MTTNPDDWSERAFGKSRGVPETDLVCGVCGWTGMPVMDPFAADFKLAHQVNAATGAVSHVTIRA